MGEDSKKRLVVRHPGTGRLMWASRLPFGYLEAPRLFCALTEAVMSRLRRRAAGMGIHFLVFVDDVLCIVFTSRFEAVNLGVCVMIKVAPRITAPLWCTREKSQLLNMRA